MKTIDKAISDAHEKCGVNAYFGNGFKSGVEFCQTWISVDIELPPTRTKDDSLNVVLGKAKGITHPLVVFYEETTNVWIVYGLGSTIEVVEWRPIEIEVK